MTSIATVMPVVQAELGGLGLYGWVFSGFFLGSLLGIVVAGQDADRHGPAIDHLRHYIDAIPDAADTDDVRKVLPRALGEVARWN